MSNEVYTKITDEQVHQVYKELDKENTSAEKLEAAEKETEKSDYKEISEMQNATDISVTGVDNSQINENKKDYLDAFSPYDIGDEDAEALLKLIYDYKNGLDKGLYNRLPKNLQVIADGFKTQARINGVKKSNDATAKFLLDSFINDAKLNRAVEEFTTEMNDTMNDMNRNYNLIFNDAIDEIFANIDKIKEEDPERAEIIISVKKAFEDAMLFEKQMEYIDHLTLKKLNKYHGGKRLSNDVYYFNKRVNVTEIKIPDIGELPAIIKNHLPEYDMDTIEKFVSVLVKTTTDLTLEGDENINNVAYVYRIVGNIYDYKYSSDPESEKYNTVFGNIAKALDKIKNIK